MTPRFVIEKHFVTKKEKNEQRELDSYSEFLEVVCEVSIY